MIGIVKHRVTLSPAGSAGSATDTQYTDEVNGLLIGAYIDYTSQPSTTDVTLSCVDPAFNYVVVSNTNTDGYYPIRIQSKDSTGTAITGVYDLYPLDGPIKVVVAQGDAVTAGVVVTIYIQQDNL